MRVQHNIMAMNSYRNYNNNVSSLSANLEKLSSGYRINRAGDDAAGLAISEKMRAQITGLDAAQKNVKDGISLVKTAEGALQEVQDMMNRMVYLATQSANGTYDNDIDRDNLQKEVDSLMKEINRIADSANFNGQKLLDGSMSGIDVQNVAAGVSTVAATAGDVVAATTDTWTATLTYASGDTVTINGVTYTVSDTADSSTTPPAFVTTGDIDAAISAAIGTITGYTVSVSNGAVKIEATATGAGTITAGDIGLTVSTSSTADDATSAITNSIVGTAAVNQGDDIEKAYGATAVIDLNNQVKAGTTITIGDKTYEFVEASGDELSEGSDYEVVIGADADESETNLLNAITANAPTDVTAEVDNTDADNPTIKLTNASSTDNTTAIEVETAGGGLQLQIGDTSEDYNQLMVSIQDMHAEALVDKNGVALSEISVATQSAASDAINTIKDAINLVSSQRGDLGAIQNRLEHTMNNLSVMEENITDAESTIRDTDIADEMMAYTKNNILIQTSQAMLAQANMVPQGVLSLLQ